MGYHHSNMAVCGTRFWVLGVREVRLASPPLAACLVDELPCEYVSMYRAHHVFATHLASIHTYAKGLSSASDGVSLTRACV